MLETPSRSLLRHCSGLRTQIYQYGLSVTLLAKAVHGRNLLTVYVRVQWVVSWNFFGSFTPHFSNNNFFTGWYLLTRIDMGPWPVDRFCLGRLWLWSRVQSRENPHQIFSKRQIGITAPWIHHGDVIKWKLFFRYWPLVREYTGLRWIPLTVASDAMLWCFVWSVPLTNDWANSRDAGGLRRHRAHDEVTVLISEKLICQYGLSVPLLAKAIYGRNLLIVYVRVQ